MKTVAAILVVTSLAFPKFEQESPMTKAARMFVASLTEHQRSGAVLAPDSPDRTTWTYVPGKRLGISWGELTEPQKAAGQELLRVSLSASGYKKIQDIRSLEPVLGAMENGNKERDPERYWFVFFGTPNRESPWLWRYEGHHVSLTFGSSGDVVVSSTPQFLGSNPAEVKSGDRQGFRVLAQEQDLGFRLVESLTTDQRKKAILAAEAPSDIVTASSRKAAIEGRFGLPYPELDSDQKNQLRALVKLYASEQAESEQKRRLDAVEKEGYDHLVFAWLGPVERKGRHYYRIQGESFVIEYDNTQADGNHIHTVWRDFDGDFGADALAEHYEHDHHHE